MDIRNPTETELADLINNVSRAFSYNKEEGNVAKDFPQLYNTSNLCNLWVAKEGEELVAHAGFFPTEMRVENLILPVAGIGGVYTAQEFQGQGIASVLVQKCVAEASKKGAALAFLWSDRHDFYANQGFHLTGRQWTIELDPSFAPKLREKAEHLGVLAAEIKIIEGDLEEDFIKQSHALLSHYPIGIARTIEQHKNYLTLGSCRVISAWSGDALLGYFLLGKGKDLKNYIHEWVGVEGALHHLAAQCLESFGSRIFIISPQFMPDEVNWIYSLDEMRVPMRAEYMALVKLLDWIKIKKLTSEYLKKFGVTEKDFDMKKEGENFKIFWRKEMALELSESDLLKFLFGPEMPAHPELKALFPLRLWYWGMDSV